MNTNRDATVVLCFGDSNTHGAKPDDNISRFSADIRWTGRLQTILGDQFCVIEEGLGGRTVDIDKRSTGRSGRQYILPCLESHNPIDIVLVMLDTNDLQMPFKRTLSKVAKSLGELVDDIKLYGKDKHGNTPKLVLISPVPLDHKAPLFNKFFKGEFDQTSAEKSKHLADYINKTTLDKGCFFADASKVAKVGEDGVHLGIEAHKNLADLTAKIVKTLSDSDNENC